MPTNGLVSHSWQFAGTKTNPQILRMSHIYKGFKLGPWQSSQRSRYSKGTLDQDKIEKLEKIEFIWDLHQTAFEKGFQETLNYKNQYGDPNCADRHYITPSGYNLWHWQDTQRQSYKKGNLLQDRIRRLEEIDFKLDPHKDAFEEVVQETLKYKEQTGDANALIEYKTSDGYPLGSRQAALRTSFKKGILSKKGELSQDRIDRLQELGFIWDKREAEFEMGIRETVKYKEGDGKSNPNTPPRHKTSNGFNLYPWQNSRRVEYRKGTLPADRIKALEEIGGFVWNLQDKNFETLMLETLKYKEREGTPNATQNYKTSDGYTLGDKHNSLKQRYWRGQLSSEQIKRLEEIGFSWGSRYKEKE